MSLLPAVVPDIPDVRAEIVPARLARKIAPLFGVRWAASPFGTRTWVSDFGRITLSEIARGAPLPTRSRAARLPIPDEPWAIVDRMGVTGVGGALPNEIANATLNRFGPDTKAAVLLTGVNRLCDPLTAAVNEALDLLTHNTRGEPLSPGLRLAGWAALVLETFRSQPALFTAGIQARAVQRPLLLNWDVPLAPDAEREPLTRCEISSPEAPLAPSRPRDLEVVDLTFQRLGALDSSQPPLSGSELHEACVGLILRRILGVGTLQDASHLWLSARQPGSLAVEAYLPPTPVIDWFVRSALRIIGLDDSALDQGGPLPRPIGPDSLQKLPELTRRALIIAWTAMLRQVLERPIARERARAEVLEQLGRVSETLEVALPASDPVRVVSECRVAAMRVGILRHDAQAPLGEAVAELRASTAACVALFRAGSLDRGAAAEIVTASNVELNALRWTNAELPGSGLPEPEELEQELRQRWRQFLDMLQVPAAVLNGDAAPSGLLGYHLHNYAAFLASHCGQEDDARAAVDLFDRIVLPARAAFVQRTGEFGPMRVSLHIASRATTELAEARRGAGDHADARRWAAQGYTWISRALADSSTETLLGQPTEGASRFALRAVPALILACELGVSPDTETDRKLAGRLIDLVRSWEQQTVKDPPRHVRHDEVERWAQRLDKLS